MRFYVRSKTETQVTLVNVETGEKFNVSDNTLSRLFGVEFEVGDVWDVHCARQDEIAQWFRCWREVVSRA